MCRYIQGYSDKRTCNDRESRSISSIESTITVIDGEINEHTAQDGIFMYGIGRRGLDKLGRTVIEIHNLNVHISFT
jgi:hypothetical protein